MVDQNKGKKNDGTRSPAHDDQNPAAHPSKESKPGRGQDDDDMGNVRQTPSKNDHNKRS